jgi:hypothetical protein
MEKCGVEMLLAGHLHMGYSGDVRTHHEAIKSSILSIQAGTAISTRRRGEPNAYNVIRIDREQVIITVRAWDGEGFSPTVVTEYRRLDNVWTPQEQRGHEPPGVEEGSTTVVGDADIENPVGEEPFEPPARPHGRTAIPSYLMIKSSTLSTHPTPPLCARHLHNYLYVKHLRRHKTPSCRAVALRKSRLLQYCFFSTFRELPKGGQGRARVSAASRRPHASRGRRVPLIRGVSWLSSAWLIFFRENGE